MPKRPFEWPAPHFPFPRLHERRHKRTLPRILFIDLTDLWTRILRPRLVSDPAQGSTTKNQAMTRLRR